MLRDLSIGKVAENLVVDIIVQHKGIATLNEDKKTRSFYDIVASVDTHEFKVEVKNDVYALRSGNLAIEIFNPKSNKPSGLMITQSELWAHILGTEVWLTSTKDLKQFLNDNTPHRIIDAGGDKNATMYLYKRDIIIPAVFHRIDQITKPKFKKILCSLLST